VSTCSQCDKAATVAVKTQGRDSVRGMSTTVYYEPQAAPRGSEPQCTTHAQSLLLNLIEVLA
jgi:hypothetical protein